MLGRMQDKFYVRGFVHSIRCHRRALIRGRVCNAVYFPREQPVRLNLCGAFALWPTPSPPCHRRHGKYPAFYINSRWI